MSDRLLRRPDVEARTGLSRSTLYHLMSLHRFPRPVSLTERTVAWKESEVLAWIEGRTAKIETK